MKGGTEDTFDISYKTLTDIERGISESCEGVLKDISENEFANATGRVISDAEELDTFLCHICATVETAIDVNSLLYEELKRRAFPESASDKTITLTMEELKAMEKDDWKPTQKIKDFLSECEGGKRKKQGVSCGDCLMESHCITHNSDDDSDCGMSLTASEVKNKCECFGEFETENSACVLCEYGILCKEYRENYE